MRHIFLLVLLCATSCVLAGCASRRDLVATHQVSISADPGPNVTMIGPSVIAVGDTLHISGAVIRKPGNDTPMAGHVEVSTVKENGDASDVVSASLDPRSIPTTGEQRSTFDYSVLGVPPKGTVIKAVFVDELHPTIDYFAGMNTIPGGGPDSHGSGGGGGSHGGMSSAAPRTLGAPHGVSSAGHGGKR